MGEKKLMMIEEILSFMTEAVEQYVINFGIDDIDEYLNVRDENTFNKRWAQAQAEIAMSTAINTSDLTFKAQKKTLQKNVFNSVAKLTQHYELADYISEDAGLIFTNQYFKVNNEFANCLVESYKTKKLPQ